jgi:hypothetical protein
MPVARSVGALEADDVRLADDAVSPAANVESGYDFKTGPNNRGSVT